MPSILDRRMRGFSDADDAAIRRNLSYVLHEHERSAAIDRAIDACLRHQRLLHRLGRWQVPVAAVDAADVAGVSDWLSVEVGLPHQLAAVLNNLSGVSPRMITLIDADCPSDAATTFFRGPARLCLPDLTPKRLGVAALTLRPDGRTAHLKVSGVFEWPDDASQAIEAVERLIQPFAGQWLARRSLWRLPAEDALPGEIR